MKGRKWGLRVVCLRRLGRLKRKRWVVCSGKVVFASHHRPEVIHRPMEAKGEKIFAGNVLKIVKTGERGELLC
ncbi:MAG: hypothetical protein ACTS6P_01905 [Candidatus Hodgkinia cicadicola]